MTSQKMNVLTEEIESARESSEIIKVISGIESYLSSHSDEQNRSFFTLAFPTLISKFFGLENYVISRSPYCPAWVEMASYDCDLADKLFAFFSPKGPMFFSMFAIDRYSLVKYVFPLENLPCWIKFTLQTIEDCRIFHDVCPLFRGRVDRNDNVETYCKNRFHLNVFEYLMFWFGYYPVCKGNYWNWKIGDNFSWKLLFQSILPSRWSKQIPEHKGGYDLYLSLLYVYLQAFVPKSDVSPPPNLPLECIENLRLIHCWRAEFVVNVFAHYWLISNDVSPLSVNVIKPCTGIYVFTPSFADQPPPRGLGDVVRLFVTYLNFSLVQTAKLDNKLGSVGFLRSPEIPSWNAYIQRPLYRFLVGTFLRWRSGLCMENISKVFPIWIDYLEPWKFGGDDRFKFDPYENSSWKDGVQLNQPPYSTIWEGYVVSNYLFYSSLVIHFIRFARKFIHNNAKLILPMVSKIVDILTSSRAIMDLIKNVDCAFHSIRSGTGKSAVNRLREFVPQIHEHLQDWEDGLSDVDGSSLHGNRNRDLTLFSAGEDGGPQLLELFILEAENEIRAMSGDNFATDLQCLRSLTSKLRFFVR